MFKRNVRVKANIKKKIYFLFSMLLLTVVFTGTVFAAEQIFSPGDVNADGTVNLKDVTLLQRYFANTEEVILTTPENADVNADGEKNLKDVTVLQRYLAGGWGIELPEPAPIPGEETPDEDLKEYPILETKESAEGITSFSVQYGKSELERDLVCWSIHPENYEKTILLNFEIHGWEDSYAGDGQLLVNLGNALVEHYSQSENLQNCRLLIIPSCNPDGLAEGTTNNGFGRCNAKGIDLNRDFDADHIPYAPGRNYTEYPFSAAETRAMRDLVLAATPDIVIDFHGWENSTIGSGDVAEVFSLKAGLNHKNEFSANAHGYFSYWAQKQGAEGLLVEFKNPDSIVTDHVIAAIDMLIEGNYGTAGTGYEMDSLYQEFGNIKSYTLSTGHVYTQRAPGEEGTDYGYIDGAADQCTIKQIYADGWCKVNYPLSSGFMKTGFCRTSEFIDPNTAVDHYSAAVAQNTSVYTRPDGAVKQGSVWTTDTFTVIAEKGNMLQIVYPLDEGGYKMGWIAADAVIRN